MRVRVGSDIRGRWRDLRRDGQAEEEWAISSVHSDVQAERLVTSSGVELLAVSPVPLVVSTVESPLLDPFLNPLNIPIDVLRLVTL